MGAFVAESVNLNLFSGDFVNEMFWDTFYLQHCGTDHSGMAMLDKNGKILAKTHPGWFRPAFQNDLAGFVGPLGIGHISAKNPEPILLQSTFPDFALCLVGSINNREQIRQMLLEKGQVFTPDCHDASLLAHLIATVIWNQQQTEKENFARGINYLSRTVKGSFAVAILTENQIFVARGLDGHQMVVLGKKEGAVVAASESCGFYNLGFMIDRELEPGEIVSLQDGLVWPVSRIYSEIIIPQPCSFKWVYTANPASIFLDINVKAVRQELGARLARRDIAAGFYPDGVVPIKDSGGYAAIGYMNEFIRQVKEGKVDAERLPYYDEALLRFIYAGRSFTPSDEQIRTTEARIKQIPIPDPAYAGLKVVIVDDSIVTGNQFKRDLVPKVRACGFSEVHARISFPMLTSTCPWGSANKKKNKLAAVKGDGEEIRTEEEMAKYLGLESCQYNTVRDVVEAIGIPEHELCLDCARL
ncbi:MAG: hypothetical protein WCV41_00465 [Patescibacteria group bacterium]